VVVHKFGAVIRKHFPQHKKTQVLDCPSCGKDDQLWFPMYLYSFFILLKTWNRLPRRKKRAPV